MKDENLITRQKQCNFLAHCEAEFGYTLWNLIARTINRSTNVIFSKDQTSKIYEYCENFQDPMKNH